MFIDHRRDRPRRHLEWRIRLMGAGALLALVGMYFQARWMVWIAIAVLTFGFLLRFAGGRPSDGGDDEGPPDR